MNTAETRLSLTEVSPAYWRVTLHNPPVNLMNVALVQDLVTVLDRIEKSQDLKVAVFDSADEDFYIAHFDVGDEGVAAMCSSRTKRR